MKKTIPLLVLVFLFGILAGGAATVLLRPESAPPAGTAAAATQTTAESAAQASCLDAAVKAAAALRDGDFKTLADMVHPQKGVLFVPYSMVDPQKNLNFTADKVRAFDTDKTDYIWGLTDGEGAPIELTPKDYIKKYVYDKNYLSSSIIGINTIVKTGNSLENVKEAFPGADFVEFHIPGDEEKYGGLDWSSLRLVFERFGERYCLVAVIHSQWTI